MPDIHPTAVVSPAARLAEDVQVGPHAVIEAEVSLAAGCRVGPASLLGGPSEFGPGNVFYGHCSIGADSQDKKHAGGGRLRVGAGNMFREFATVNRSTAAEGTTVIGDRNLIMSYAHVAHDCQLGNDIVLSNAVQLAGHVEVGDRAIVGGSAVVQQHCRIGMLALVGGATAARADVPPYVKYVDKDGRTKITINSIGMQRSNMASSQIEAAARALRLLYRKGLTRAAAAEAIGQLSESESCLAVLAAFLASVSPDRGIVRPH